MQGKLSELFRQCIVCIKTPNGQGSGFFVAPGWLLSCTHVIQGTDLSQISVNWRQQSITPIQIKYPDDRQIDLVLIQIRDTAHPCVYLDNEAEPGHELYSFGYPDHDREGSSITVECEGPSDNGHLLTIKDENIRSGFSGAPLLNQRTLKVCGIIKSERQVKVLPHVIRSLGGQAIPTTLVLQHFPELVERNRKFHQRDKRWKILIEEDARPPKPSPFFNLPSRDHDRLFGRQQELKKLLKYISPDYRQHITVVDGIGGVGKTALVLDTAHRCWEAKHGKRSAVGIPIFDAIIFTSAKETMLTVGGIQQRPQKESTLQDIFRMIAITLDEKSIIHASARQQIQRVKECLRKHRTLLIVDNFETISIKERNRILAFLDDVPAPTQVIITSRELIGRTAIRLECLSEEEGCRLVRAQATSKGVILEPNEDKRIHRRLNGIPAALIYVVGQKALGFNIERLLKSEDPLPEDIARFCFEESVTLLRQEPAHKLLMTLAIFPHSPLWEAMAAAAGMRADPIGVDKGLQQLIQLSLVSAPEDRRYRILPITREYVLAELSQYKEFEVEAKARWVNWYIDYVEKWGGEDWEDWRSQYDHLDVEWPNILAVLDWCVAQDDYYAVKRLWISLDSYIDLYGYWQVRLRWWGWLARKAKRRGDTATWVKAVSERSWTLTLMGGKDNHHRATICLTEAWQLCEQVDLDTQLHVVNHLTVLASTQQEYTKASDWLEIEEQLLREAAFEPREVLRHQAQIAYYQAEIYFQQKIYAAAKPLFQQVMVQGKQIGWQRFVNYAQNYLANIAIEEGDLKLASRLVMTGLQVARASNEKRRLAHYLASYAYLEKAWGNLENACKQAEQALVIFESEKVERQASEMRSLICDLKDRLGGNCRETLRLRPSLNSSSTASISGIVNYWTVQSY